METQLLDEQKRKMAQRKEDYDNLINTLQQGSLALAQRAYDMTLEPLAARQREAYSEDLAEFDELLRLGHTPDGSDEISIVISQYRDLYQGGRYEEAMEMLSSNESAFLATLHEARRLRASQQLSDIRQKLDEVNRSLRASENAPELYEEAQAFIDEAQGYYDGEDYGLAYNILVQADEAVSGIQSVMSADAERFIAEGREEARVAEELGARNYAAKLLDDGLALLDEAETYTSITELARKYASARTGYDSILNAKNTTRRLKAEQALGRASVVMDRAAAENAPEFVAASYAAANSAMGVARAAYNDGRYEEVLELAAAAESAANDVIAALQARAQEDLAGAQAAVASAVEALSEKYQTERTGQAGSSLSSAETAFAQGRFGTAIQSALNASASARSAERETYRLRTEETRRTALQEQQLAIDSGAKDHSPEMFLAGLDALAESRTLYDETRYKEALAVAQRSLDSFHGARFRIINEANAAIESARAARAEEYEPRQLQNALAQLADARIAMNEARYTVSNETAASSRRVAEQAENATWKTRTEEQLATNKGNIARLAANLAPQKVEATYRTGVDLEVAAEKLYGSASYHEAYDTSVKAAQTLEQAENELIAVAEGDIQKLDDHGSAVLNLGGGDYTAQEVSRVYAQVNAARESVAGKAYKTAFEQVAIGNDLAIAVEQNVKTNNVTQGIASIRQTLASMEANGVLLFVPEPAAEIRAKAAEIETQRDFITYDEAMAEIGAMKSAAEAMEQTALDAIDDGLSTAQRLLDEARRAQALVFVRDTYFDATDAYKRAMAYRELLDAPVEGNFKDMHSLYEVAVKQADKVHADTNQIRDEKAYKDIIFYNDSSYMNDMASLLLDFSSVTNFTPQFYRAAKSSKDVDIYRQLQKRITAPELLNRSRYLYDSVSNYVPPSRLEGLHKKVVESFDELVKAADLFVRYGEYGKYQDNLRQQFIEDAFLHLAKVKILNEQIEAELVRQERESEEGVIQARGWFSRFWEDLKQVFYKEKYRRVL